MKASIITATHNRADFLEKCINAILAQSFKSFELIIVNDCSTDNTREALQKFSKSKKVRIINLEKNLGPVGARNKAFEISRGEIIIVMDDDCVAEKKWLSAIMQPFKNKKIGMATAYGEGAGTSTAYLRKAIGKKFFDECFKVEPFSSFSFREDTDLTFRILEKGFLKVEVPHLFAHYHRQPQTLLKKIKYAWSRLSNHVVDPLLFKKHPAMTAKFLNIKFGFLRDPLDDFKTATGLWFSKENYGLRSPQGVKFIDNKTVLHEIAIISTGVIYVLLVKAIRLYGSIIHEKFMV